MGNNIKNIFSVMKREGFVIKPLDLYLMNISEGQDRAINVNAPSQAGVCLRARYYARVGEEKDTGAIEPRTRRIFDNGHHVHERLQEYLMNQGILKIPEIPVHDLDYNIQGHTDGLLDLGDEYAVLEIKSINSKNFGDLNDAKDDHKRQGLVYLHCLEKHRQFLRAKYKNNYKFLNSGIERKHEYMSLYEHLKDGGKYTRDEKIKFQVDLHLQLDKILWSCNSPLTKVVFLYENKDTQDLKEFLLSSGDDSAKSLMCDILKEYEDLNYYVDNKIVPQRQSANKNDYMCRWCNNKNICWIV